MLENQAEVNKLKSSLIKYFEAENNFEIVAILKASQLTTVEIYFDSRNGGVSTYALVFEMEIKEFQKYKLIFEQMREQIFNAVGLFTQNTGNEYIGEIRFAPLFMQYIDWSPLNGITTKEKVLEHIEQLKSIMISVATGGPKIQTRDNDYKANYVALSDFLAKLGIENPNKFKSLWD